ncbi:sporulation integral membrane protein YtvI [Paenibacillus sp. N1-5-1-14]|uniref:sporulation integral membrane protein YtvI n=1 Tax=Paenibacillus radicibacter TaxID=2972488 RepID=UPI00215963B1|nr:sporulation integral membrane protein YtvI [Paenibacillus radicibacter]MCR8643852.1 sporulation integral membrane protein YtvI [Paenibacillus radicibacter]
MIPFYKKYYKTIIDIALILLTVYLFMLLFSFLYKIAAPIFWAFAIFLIIEPFAKFMNKRGVKKMVATTISTILFLVILLGVITGLGLIVTNQILHFSEKVPEYTQTLQNSIVLITEQVQSSINALSPDTVQKITEYASGLTANASKIMVGTLKFLGTSLSSVSSFMISFGVNFGVGLILAFFLSIEFESWKRVAREKTPATFKKVFEFLSENVIKGIVTYISAQAKLISITFVIVLISLFALGIKNAFTMALLAGFFDVLPLLGVSTLFIPWIIYLFIVGQTSLAIWLTVIWLVVVVARQLLEPKITGDSLGVSAFTMLSFMIISLSLFGFIGLIVSPVLIILLKALHEQGYLKRWIRTPEEEFPAEQTDDKPAVAEINQT